MTFPWPRALLTCGALLPYWRFLTFNVLYVTDDYFASDIYNGELPGRVLIGQSFRNGQWPVWTSQLCSGVPLAGAPADPLGVLTFALLAPAAALDLYVILLLLIAAHGTYSLARRFGADTIGSVLAGLAFAGCGYIACQLKHLGIIATVVWLPVGMLLIDRVLAPADADGTRRISRRVLDAGLFGLVFAQQSLAGFPQSAYICALVYGSFALFRALNARRLLGHPRTWQLLLAVLAVAVALGAASGAMPMLPLSQLGAISDRSEPPGWDWATRLAYWPSNLVQFLFPYANGDISDNSYAGPPFFWEDYGYVGIITFLLAVYGGVRERKRPMVLFAIAMTVVAMLFVLGRATFVFHVAYLLIPGLKMFRFPTRFLFVVEAGLAVLAAVGLTRLRQDLAARAAIGPRAARTIAIALCGLTVVDLTIHQPRQNPIVPAGEWLAPPRSVDLIRADTAQPRTFTPRHRDLHRSTFQRARGWVDVTPYFELRDVLQPNLGGALWNMPSADCYAGIAASWYVNVWADHNRENGFMNALTSLDFGAGVLRAHPRLPRVLGTYGVTHMLSAYPQEGSSLPFVGRGGMSYVYRVDGSARVRVVASARPVADDREAARGILDAAFDPNRVVFLHDAAPPDVSSSATESGAPASTAGRAAITQDSGTEIVIEAEAMQDAYLLLADTYYPGWTARVDGAPTLLYRANVSVRAIRLPKGKHEVRFSYVLPGFARGAWITLGSLSGLLLWTAGAVYLDRSARR